MEFRTSSADETERAGVLLGRLVRPGDVIALSGDLGAGKTHLVQGIAAALGVAEPVTSPTFNLLLVHPGRVPLYHFDLYRLEHEDELEELAFYETLESDGVSAIEWGDRFPRALPPDHLGVAIHREGEDQRRFEVSGQGERSAALAREWAAAVGEERG
jgi:tRNA threonylcarbamoyladenosine biosynthesis protein TsaE